MILTLTLMIIAALGALREAMVMSSQPVATTRELIQRYTP
jgi:hypothetical protein